MPKDYSTYSFWLETCGDDLTPRPSLPGSMAADIAILGAGYSGLWTAYYLLQRRPNLRIVILESEIAGFGASGRNGGWCSSGFPLSPGVLEERFGREAARNLQLAMFDAVDEVGRICTMEGIKAEYRKGGELNIARGPQQLPSIEHEYRTFERLGLADHIEVLSRRQTDERIRIAGALGAIYSPHCAAIQPARLVRGLAKAVERRGGIIYEQTEVTDFETRPEPTFHTLRGEVRAKTIVLAGESYLTRLAKLHRQLIPVYSLITVTEPLSDEQWERIGWAGNECVSSYRYTVDYLQRTLDNRILFGSRGAPYHLGSTIRDEYDRYQPTHTMIHRLFAQWFPSLKDVRFTHSWGGTVGMPRDLTPTIAYDAASGIATARGYTGQGVATSNLAGRILAGLITGTESPITHLPIVGHHSPNWEPEPLRWLGVRYVQRAYGRIDAKAERTGTPPSGKTLAERLGKH